MIKYIRDGEVAVLYSPGYGAGWSTWAEASERDLLLFDPDIVQLVLDRNSDVITPDEFEQKVDMIWQLKSYASYCSPATLEVMWLPVGTLFKVEEYDGSESIITQQDIKWHVA